MDDVRGVDLNLFVILDALIRHRSVSRAAESLGMSQSAVSHALARLRRHFGDPLFLKTREGVAPTARALALAPDAAQFVAFAQKALVGRGGFDPATSQRVINMNLTDMAELQLLPTLMQRLAAVAPGCRLQTVQVRDMQEALESGAIDLAIYGPLKTARDIRQQKLFEHVFVVIASRDCPIGPGITIEDFCATDQVVISPTRSDRMTIEAQLARRGLHRKAALTTPHWLAVPHIVGASRDYLAIVPLSLAELYKDFCGLKILTTAFELPKIEILQYWHARSEGDAFNGWFRALVREAFFKNAAVHIR